MIHVFGSPDPPVPRLIAALTGRGHSISPAAAGGDRNSATLVLAGGSRLDRMALGVLLGAWRYAAGARVLILSRLGSHPDARAKSLRELWDLEEYARTSGMATLTLRFAPLLGPTSPMWLRMRESPRLPNGGRALVQPVAESDVVETLDRLFRNPGRWDGWYELAGAEAFTLAELVELARPSGAPRAHEGAAWEPPLQEIAEHRLADNAPWIERFGIAPKSIREEAASWLR
jgi:uncharacterized protein YbjT (DUF2867 family)